MFLRNVWYPAAWEREVGQGPHATTLLNERVAIFRRTDGSYAALEDACPHRKLPLSMGRVKGDHLECGYHGLVFDCTGKCVKVPGATRTPAAAAWAEGARLAAGTCLGTGVDADADADADADTEAGAGAGAPPG